MLNNNISFIKESYIVSSFLKLSIPKYLKHDLEYYKYLLFKR